MVIRFGAEACGDIVLMNDQAAVRAADRFNDGFLVPRRKGTQVYDFDIAAQGLGLILVPLYVNDRAENISLVLEDFVAGSGEAMEVIRLALDNESFSYHGDIYDFPPPGIPDRGGFVEELTLVPQPLHPYEIWQAITSPPTLEAVPRKGWGGVMWLKHHTFMKSFWDRYAELYEEARPALRAAGLATQ